MINELFVITVWAVHLMQRWLPTSRFMRKELNLLSS